MARSARPGQKLTEVYTSKWYREQNKRRPPPPRQRELPKNTSIKFRAVLDPTESTALTKEVFDIVAITGPALETDAATNTQATSYLRCKVKDGATSDNWAVLQGPLNDNSSPEVVLLGVTWAKMTVNSAGDTHVTVDDGELVGASSGPALLLLPPYQMGTPSYPFTGIGFIMIRGGASQDENYFILLEDATADEVWAERSNKDGDSLGSPFKLQNWQNVIGGAQAGYHGQYTSIGSTRDFQQGPCITECQSAGVLNVGTAPDGTVDEVYGGHSVSSSGLDGGSLSVSNLPPGITADGSGTLSGTPTTAGTYYVEYTATADKTGPGTPSPGSKCTLTRVVRITINEEEA